VHCIAATTAIASLKAEEANHHRHDVHAYGRTHG